MKNIYLLIICVIVSLSVSAKTYNRPQTPIPPYPYDTVDICLKNPTDVTILNGTVTYPTDGKSKAAIILASGSGAQNRDEEIFGHRPFKVIADFLSRHGYTVLRFDDRIFDCANIDSVLNFTVDTFLTDIVTGVEYLKQKNYDKIGIIGHSEGGSIAIKAAAKYDNIDFIITLAAPAFRGDSIILSQTRVLLEKQGVGSAWESMYYPMLKRRYNLVMSSLPTDTLKDRLYKDVIANTPSGMLTQPMIDKIKSELAVMSSEWYREMLRYDPTNDITNINVDWLALNGEKDLQVLPDNLNKIRELNPNVSILQFENLNHLFQNCTTGLPGEYAQIEETISEEVLSSILQWLDSRFSN